MPIASAQLEDEIFDSGRRDSNPRPSPWQKKGFAFVHGVVMSPPSWPAVCGTPPKPPAFDPVVERSTTTSDPSGDESAHGASAVWGSHSDRSSQSERSNVWSWCSGDVRDRSVGGRFGLKPLSQKGQSPGFRFERDIARGPPWLPQTPMRQREARSRSECHHESASQPIYGPSERRLTHGR